MKKTTKLFLVVLCLVCVTSLILLTACNNNGEGNDLEKTITVVIGEGENATVSTVTTGARYLADVLNEMVNDEDSNLTLVGTYSIAYGLYVTEIGAVKADALKGEYVYFFTTDTEYQEISEFAVSKEFDGKTLVSATKGVSSLPVKDGETYLITLISFS